MTGYVKLEDREIIKKINQTGRIALDEHVALYRRLQNRSYTEPVYLTTQNLRDRQLRAGLVHTAWIKLPVVGESFVGWDFLHHCREVRLIHARQSDLKILVESVNKWRFNCTQVIQIDEENVPAPLKHIALFRSVNRIIKSKPDGLQIHEEKLSKDDILLG